MFQKPDSSGAVGHLSGRGCLTASNVLDNKSRKKVSKCDSKKVTNDLKEGSRVWRWQSGCKELKNE